MVAWEVSRHLDFLRSASTGDPPDPLVLLLLAAHEDTPAARRKAAESFASLYPERAIGDYLMAFHVIENGGREEVMRHLAAASAKPGSALYESRLQDEIQDAYEFIGKDPLVAKALASRGVNPASGTQLMNLEKHVAVLFQEQRAAGDEAGAAALMRDGLLLAERCQASGTLLDNLVSSACKSMLLKQLPPDAVPIPDGPTAREMLADIKARRDEIVGMVTTTSENLGRIPGVEANRYFDILRAEGELAAGRWLSQWLSAGNADDKARKD
jgi:hypothetical protein